MSPDYLCAQDIAAGTGLAVGTVYWMASRDRWRRTSSRPRGYLVEDVRATLARTGPGRAAPAAA